MESLARCHQKIGSIPDPARDYTASLQSLSLHAEVLENTERFVQLTTDSKVLEVLTDPIYMGILLSMLPIRISK